MNIRKTKMYLLPLILCSLWFAFNAQAQILPEDGVEEPPQYVSYQQIHNIKKIIGENTPDFIAKPIIAIVEILEGFRLSIALSIDTEIEKLKAELEVGEKEDVIPEQRAMESEFSKPWQQTKLFVLSIASEIFNSRFIFYFIVFVILLLILRVVWRVVF